MLMIFDQPDYLQMLHRYTPHEEECWTIECLSLRTEAYKIRRIMYTCSLIVNTVIQGFV